MHLTLLSSTLHCGHYKQMQKTTMSRGCLLTSNTDADAVALLTNTSKFIALLCIGKSVHRKKNGFLQEGEKINKCFSLRDVG